MCTAAPACYGRIDLLEDPLIRLVMQSDGVSAHEVAELLERVRQALLSVDRKSTTRAGQPHRR